MPAFSAIQESAQWVSFYLLDQVRKKVVASIHFHLSDRLARSPFKAPFGSVESSKKINASRLYIFLEYIERRLKEKGIEDVHIKNPPRAYAPESLSLMEVFFLNQKFEVADAE